MSSKFTACSASVLKYSIQEEHFSSKSMCHLNMGVLNKFKIQVVTLVSMEVYIYNPMSCSCMKIVYAFLFSRFPFIMFLLFCNFFLSLLMHHKGKIPPIIFYRKSEGLYVWLTQYNYILDSLCTAVPTQSKDMSKYFN